MPVLEHLHRIAVHGVSGSAASSVRRVAVVDRLLLPSAPRCCCFKHSIHRSARERNLEPSHAPRALSADDDSLVGVNIGTFLWFERTKARNRRFVIPLRFLRYLVADVVVGLLHRQNGIPVSSAGFGSKCWITRSSFVITHLDSST